MFHTQKYPFKSEHEQALQKHKEQIQQARYKRDALVLDLQRGLQAFLTVGELFSSNEVLSINKIVECAKELEQAQEEYTSLLVWWHSNRHSKGAPVKNR